MNVFVSTGHVGFTVPAQYAHLARGWQDVCHLKRLFWITHRPATSPKRPFVVSKLILDKSGFHSRSSTRYATLDNAVRAAQRLAAASA